VGVVSVARDIPERIRTEEELRQYRENLENMVSERTAELTRANERLALEIEERTRAQDALRESERKARAILDQTFQLIGLMTRTAP
jgi:C4-dicarboxylate-specific signal transduction histidine kinase